MRTLLPAALLLGTAAADPLNVHIIAHSHDDVGWLKTLNEYFDGSNQHEVPWSVEYIISTVMNGLRNNPERKFSQVEIKFFSKWWETQTLPKQAEVAEFVKNGQLEFLNAGWSMHDEACTSFEDMITNMQLGQLWVKEKFGVTPKAGWQIDPFGHSNANAQIFYELGFSSWFFARMDEGERAKRAENKELEWILRPNNMTYEDGSRPELLTHFIPGNLYFSPDGFDFNFGEDTWESDRNLTSFNGKEMYERWDTLMDDYRQNFATNEVMLLFGGDFQWVDAEIFFTNLDNMISYINENHSDKYNLKYSTPSIYTEALHALDRAWPVKYDDMFPYSNDPTNYWTGYFTSRANSKGEARRGQHNHGASSQLYAETFLNKDYTDKNQTKIQKIKEGQIAMADALGIYQHHDGITGTAKQHVADDYSKRLDRARILNSESFSDEIIRRVQDLAPFVPEDLYFAQCEKENTTYLDCPISNYTFDADRPNTTIAVYNPSSVDVHSVQIPVPHGKFMVLGYSKVKGEFLGVDSVDVHCSPDTYFNETGSLTNVTNCQMFIQMQVNARTISLLQLVPSDTFNYEREAEVMTPQNNKISVLDRTLEFVGSDDTEQVINFRLANTTSNNSNDFDFGLKYWASFTSDDTTKNSGAYIFRPIDNLFFPLPYSNIVNCTLSQGKYNSRMTFFFALENERKAIVYVTLDRDFNAVKLDVDLNSLPNVFTKGFEVVTHFQAHNFDNDGVFYTDSNGLHMQKRILNERSYFNITEYHGGPGRFNITSNFYPINSAIALRNKDNSKQFTVMNDRSQAGSSLYPGNIQFMENRRLSNDDNKGVEEFLNETDSFGNGIRVFASYYVQFIDLDEQVSEQRLIQHKQADPLQVFYTDKLAHSATKYNDWMSTLSDRLKAAGVNGTIKMNSFAAVEGEILVRFENLADDTIDPATSHSLNVTAVAEAIWKSQNDEEPLPEDVEITRMNLAGTMEWEEMENFKWRTVDDPADYQPVPALREDPNSVTMKPMSIKNFWINGFY